MNPRKRVQPQAATTLPLFGNGSDPNHGAGGRRPTSEAATQALSVYWSAVLHAHALGAAALKARFPSEREALDSLLAVELQRKELARRVLREVWGVRLGPSSKLAPTRAA